MITSVGGIVDTTKNQLQTELWETFFAGNTSFKNSLRGKVETEVSKVDNSKLNDLLSIKTTSLGHDAHKNSAFAQSIQSFYGDAFGYEYSSQFVDMYT